MPRNTPAAKAWAYLFPIPRRQSRAGGRSTMSWTNRITLALTLAGGAIALTLYAQALSLPAHFV
ncbi:protein of unassigned function [Methylobacterium oryzae CBMB20]|uniref:Protein of unassigned function n=3 Tax=Methylobacterium TaxID=407 RepID=A0A089Q676_9HYPH|nr:protein of unassigned function [Methylobacterium oryzae CBMB20]